MFCKVFTTAFSWDFTVCNICKSNFIFDKLYIRKNLTSCHRVVAWTMLEQHCYHAWATLLDQQYCSALFEQYCLAMMKQQSCSWLLEQGEFVLIEQPCKLYCWHAWINLLISYYNYDNWLWLKDTVNNVVHAGLFNLVYAEQQRCFSLVTSCSHSVRF